MRVFALTWAILLYSLVVPVTASVAWQVQAGASHDTDLALSPTLYQGFVVTTDSRGYIVANDKQDGHQLWRFATHEPLSTGAAINEHALVVATQQSKILCYAPRTHVLRWSYHVDGDVLAKPTLAKNVVIVKTVAGALLVLDAKTGRLKWRYQHDGNRGMLLHVSNPPLVVGDQVLAGFNDGQLMAFNLKNGQPRWRSSIAGASGNHSMDTVVDVAITPVVRGDIVYVANHQGHLKALDIHTGESVWVSELATYLPLSVDANTVYAVDVNQQVVAFNRHHGGVIWRQPELPSRTLSAPSYTPDAVIVADNNGWLYWLSKQDGHLIKRERLSSGRIHVAPLVADAAIYTLSQRGGLTKYQTGRS